MTYSLGTLAAIYQYLKFDNGTGFFTAGNTLYQSVDGEVVASATIVAVIGRGEASGRVYLTDIVGTFQDDEIIYEASYGGELQVDPGIETWVGDNPSYWWDMATPTVTDETTIKHGGSHSLKCVVDGQYDGVVSATTSITNGLFYQASIWIYGDGVNTLAARVRIPTLTYFSGMDDDDGYVPPASWIQHAMVFQADGGGSYFEVFAPTGETSGTWYLDDSSVKKITNAALANGTLQDTESAVTLVPDYSYKSPDIKIESKTRTRAGRLYTTKYGSYKHFSFNVNYVSSATAALVNSWWETDTELLFLVTSGGVTETHSVMLQGETPIDGFNSPSIEYYRGKIILETY